MQILKITPRDKYSNLEMILDERIWGHRFHDEQTPWLVLLEFFAVFCFLRKQGSLFAEKPSAEGLMHESVVYSIPRLAQLRRVVFNNPFIENVRRDYSSDREKWVVWLRRMHGTTLLNDEFSYLQSNFSGEFDEFARLVDFYRETAIEAERNRRWSSKFIFPYGPSSIYADLRLRDGKLENPDRLFFARGGELLYLMLNRSSRADALSRLISEKPMSADNTWNRMAKRLLPPNADNTDSDVQVGEFGYLPYLERAEYELMAEDWEKILNLTLPGAACLDPLMRITGFHMVRYMLNRSLEEINDDSRLKFTLEVAAPRKTALFELSRTSHDHNRNLTKQALAANLNAFRSSELWNSVGGDPRDARAILAREYGWQPNQRDIDHDVFEVFYNAAMKRHASHTGRVPAIWSREIGLAVARPGAGTWYAPDDSLLKALVFANVHPRMEYRNFLSLLYNRYQLVIGIAEAELAYGSLPADEKVFTENALRLERRLNMLGLLKRLSDDCAYVTNPFSVTA